MTALTALCPQCNEKLEFDTYLQQWHCPICSSNFSKDQIAPLNPASIAEEDASPSSSEAFSLLYQICRMHTCPNCGSAILSLTAEPPKSCFYCRRLMLAEQVPSSCEFPDKIIPFLWDNETALKQFKKWKRRKWFALKGFFSKSQLRSITCVYFPYYIVDASLDGDVDTTVQKKGSKTGKKETSNFSSSTLHQQIQSHFSCLSCCANEQNCSNLADDAQKYNLGKLRNPMLTDLSGKIVVLNTMDSPALSQLIEKQVEDYSLTLLSETLSKTYTHINVTHTNFTVTQHRKLCVWLPLWVLTFPVAGHIYFFTINEQNGKVKGDLPISKSKISFAFAVLFLIAFFVILMGGDLQ